MDSKDNALENILDIGFLFRVLMMQSKLIILICSLGIAYGVGSFFLTEKTYKVSSLIQVYSQQRNNFSTQVIDIFASSAATSDLDNVEILYKTRSHMMDVIKERKLNLQILDADDQIDKKLFEIFEYSGPNSYFEFSINEKNYVYFGKNGEKYTNEYGIEYLQDGLRIKLSNPETSSQINFTVEFIDPSTSYKIVSSNFKISNSLENRGYTPYRGNGLIIIDYYTNDPKDGLETLDYANKLFIQRDIETEAEKAQKAVNFIDQRIDSVEDKLEVDKNLLKDFKETNRTVNVDLEIQSILGSITQLEEKLNEINIQIAKAATNYTDNNPIYLDLLSQKEELIRQKSMIESRIDALPLAQQRYVDLFRNLETTERIYEELLSKRLEFSIREASTLGNMRIVDEAFVDEVVDPKITDIFFISVISFIMSLIVAAVRGIYFLPVSNPAEIRDAKVQLPILGVAPLVDSTDDLKLHNSIESLVVNIQSIDTDNKLAKTILLTSPTASNGKSFLSREVAKNFSSIGKKVLLIDNDWKRGDQHNEFNLEKITLDQYKSITLETIESLKVEKNLYVLPRITRLTNSFQFIYSAEFEQKFKMFKEIFDVIIIDTAPALSVSDTSVLMSYSDINLAVVRHGITKINELKQLISVINQIGIEFDGIVYNSYEKPSSYYGYYGLYGSYEYQYYAKKYLYESYDYNEEKS